MDDCHHYRQLCLSDAMLISMQFTAFSIHIAAISFLVVDPENMENNVLHAYIGEKTEYIKLIQVDGSQIGFFGL